MSYHLRLYAGLFVVFIAIDAVWLGLIAPGFYQQHIGHLLADTVHWGAAAAFYMLFIAGIAYFVVLPGRREPRVGPSALRGALFGLITYATYDLTNMATLKDWPLIVTLVDLAWGSLLSMLVGIAGHLISRSLDR